MSDPNRAAGYGRGGRGANLMKATESTLRRPGEASQQPPVPPVQPAQPMYQQQSLQGYQAPQIVQQYPGYPPTLVPQPGAYQQSHLIQQQYPQFPTQQVMPPQMPLATVQATTPYYSTQESHPYYVSQPLPTQSYPQPPLSTLSHSEPVQLPHTHIPPLIQQQQQFSATPLPYHQVQQEVYQPIYPAPISSQSIPTLSIPMTKPSEPTGFGRGSTTALQSPQPLIEQFQKLQVSGNTTSSSGIGSMSTHDAARLNGTYSSLSFGVTTSSDGSSDPIISPIPTTSSIGATPSPHFSSQQDRKTFTGLAAGESAPRVGNAGNELQISTNYLAVKSTIGGVYKYMITFSPEIDNKNMRFKLVNMHRDLIGETRAFDGTILYSPKVLTEDTLEVESVRETDGVAVKVKIQFLALVQPADCIQLFNVILKRVMRQLKLRQVGRHYYDPYNPISIPQHKLELWPGYITSIQSYDGGLLLMLDVSHKLLRTESALDLLYDLHHQSPRHFQEEALKQLVGTVVLTRYNNKTYRVDDIVWDKNPNYTFLKEMTGEQISFIEYYKSQYHIDITDREQPLLLHRPKKKRVPPTAGQPSEEEDKIILLIPELCYMTGLTQQARNDFKVMKDVATYTRLNAAERLNALHKFIYNVNSTPDAKQELNRWKLSIDENMMQVMGRLLPVEKISFLNSSTTTYVDADWSKELSREKLIVSVDLQDWLIVFTKKDSSRAFDFYNMMSKVCPPMGIQVTEPSVVELSDDRTESYIKAIRENMRATLQMVVTIFPTSRDDRYSAIKKLCCIDSPVPSQAINSKTISNVNKLRSVTQKIALQINCKLGGELWALDIPLKSLMVVGIDVYHDTAQGKRSIGAFVASTNHYCTKWYSRVTVQSTGQELIDSLKVCFHAALRKYHEINHVLPDKIIVFRDGVGDGQMATVQSYEVPQLISCFDPFGTEYQPKFALVVVQKRISTRLFLEERSNVINPLPGSVVDHTITRKGWYDFFLVSQHVRQGTITPTHYNVVYDTSGLRPDHMQRLTYKLTHLYYNWPGTVRVPAPCQYAHKLAFLVGQSLHKSPSLDLSDRLFFL